VKPANKKWDRGEWVVTFDEHTTVEDADEDARIPGVQYAFKPIAEVLSVPEGSTIDVAAVICEAREPQSITIKNGYNAGQEKMKRDYVIWDESGDPERGTHIEFTVWGDRATEELPADTVVFLKGATVKVFRDRPSLGTSQMFTMDANPDHQRSFQLQQRWTEKGKPGYTPTLSTGGGGSSQPGSASRQSIAECKEEDLRLGAPPMPGQPLDPNMPRSVHRHTIVGTIISIANPEREPFYAACSATVEAAPSMTQGQQQKTRTCNKKVTQDQEGGGWRCNSGHMCPQPNYRYLARFQVADHSGCIEASCFDDIGVRLFGCSANQMAEMWESRNDEAQAKLQAVCYRKQVVKLRAQKEVWNDEERTKYVITELGDLAVTDEGKHMLSDIRNLFGSFT
jgi:replication factor A1